MTPWIVALFTASALAGYGDATEGIPTPEERALLVWTNAVRTAPGAFEDDYTCAMSGWQASERSAKRPFGLDLLLGRAAHAHSGNMATRGFFDHDDPQGRGPADRVDLQGYNWQYVGENIALGAPTPLDAVLGWMCSSGHRANIMEAEFVDMGPGAAAGGSGPLWTQVFGTTAAGHVDRIVLAGSDESGSGGRRLLASIDADGAPEVVAYVDGEAYAMARQTGTKSRGTWAVSVDAGAGCHLYWFEATAGGTTDRFPEDGGYAYGSCGDDDLDDVEAAWVSADTLAEAFGAVAGSGSDGREGGRVDIDRGCSVSGAGLTAWWATWCGLLGIRRTRGSLSARRPGATRREA